MHIYGPPHLETILSVQLDIIDKEWTFDIIFHPLKFGVSEKIYDDERLEVFTIPLNHSIDCNGFLFKAKGGPRKIIGDKIKEHQIPYQAIHAIKYGADFTNAQGDIIKNEELTLAPCAPKSYAYCSDTKYDESIIPFILNVDLLYHEATFMQDLQTVAQERFHSTTIEAAQIAQIAQVKKLIIGHFSARYADLNPMLTEAKTTFLHTELALEGHHFEI